LDSFYNAAFAHRFNETGANARAVSEVTNFRDCPMYTHVAPEKALSPFWRIAVPEIGYDLLKAALQNKPIHPILDL